MPLYEYQCAACGHRFEAIQKFADAPLDSCPKCGGSLSKLQSAPAFHLKGSGWYITDYAKKDQVSEGKSEGGAQKDGGGGVAAEGGEKKESPKAEKSSEKSAGDAKASPSTPAASKDSKST